MVRIILAAVLVLLVGCPEEEGPGPADGGVEDSGTRVDSGTEVDSGTPDIGPLSCEECRQHGLCMAGIEDVCPRQGACVLAQGDAGTWFTCFANGVSTRGVSLGSVPYSINEHTVYGPDGDVCYRLTVMDHWKPFNLPPGTEARSLDYVMPDGGTMHVGWTAYATAPTSLRCNGQPVGRSERCASCMPSMPSGPGCTEGVCQAP